MNYSTRPPAHPVVISAPGEAIDALLIKRIRTALDYGVRALPANTLSTLATARANALERQLAPGAVFTIRLKLASASVGVFHHLPTLARDLMLILALAASVVGAWYWNNFEQAAANADIDSALLSDELPPAAYLDRGFQTWLSNPIPAPVAGDSAH